MLDYLRKRPMLCAAVGCVITVICGYYFKIMLLIIALLILPCLVVAVLKTNLNLIIILSTVLICIASCRVALSRAETLAELQGEEITAKFLLCEISDKGETSFRSEIEILQSNTVRKGTRLAVWYKPNALEVGDVAEGRITLRKTSDGFKARNYGKGIYIEGNLSDISPTEEYDFVIKACERLRRYMRRVLFNNMSFESAATMSALVFGDMSFFTDVFYNNVKASGVAHVMVVSGMHLSILVTMILKLTEKYFYNPLLRALTMFSVVTALCSVCGFTMSILRAGLTYIIMAVGILLNRPYCPENALGAAVVLITFSTPFSVFNVGFELSVLSTFGILAVALPVDKYLKQKKKSIYKALEWLLSSVLLSLSAMLLTLPVLIYIFGYISNVAVITNLLISSAVTLCLTVTVAALFIYPLFPYVSETLLFGTDYIVRYINGVINYMGSREYAVTQTPKGFVWVSVALIFAVFYVLLACKKRSDMLKLKKMNRKIRSEADFKKWQLFLKRR